MARCLGGALPRAGARGPRGHGRDGAARSAHAPDERSGRRARAPPPGARLPRAAAWCRGAAACALLSKSCRRRRRRAPARPPQRAGGRRAARPGAARACRGCSSRTAPIRITASTAGPSALRPPARRRDRVRGAGADRGERGRSARAAARGPRDPERRRGARRLARSAPREPARLLFVGTDRPQKRGRALPALLAALPEASLTLVGRFAPPSERFAGFGGAWTSRACCPRRWAGRTPAPALLVHPAVGEAFGLAPFEAALVRHAGGGGRGPRLRRVVRPGRRLRRAAGRRGSAGRGRARRLADPALGAAEARAVARVRPARADLGGRGRARRGCVSRGPGRRHPGGRVSRTPAALRRAGAVVYLPSLAGGFLYDDQHVSSTTSTSATCASPASSWATIRRGRCSA